MKYFFVTGSSKGIGFALVKALLEKDENQVVGFSRQNEIKHERFKHISVDLADISTVKEQVNSYFEVYGEPEQITMINNAGTLGEVGYVGELASDSIVDVYNLNLIAPAILMNAFVEKFKATSSKILIVNISSGAGSYPVDGWSGYCATKAGLNMLSEVVASEQQIRGNNIRVFSLAPGIVDTGMQEKIRSSNAEQFSGVEKFVKYKENADLASSKTVAVKIMKLLEHPQNFKDVLQDVRSF